MILSMEYLSYTLLNTSFLKINYEGCDEVENKDSDEHKETCDKDSEHESITSEKNGNTPEHQLEEE